MRQGVSLLEKQSARFVAWMIRAVLCFTYPSLSHTRCLVSLFAGLLKVGTPKTWNDSRKDLGYIRKAGVRQFISTYNRVRDLKGDELLWVSLV